MSPETSDLIRWTFSIDPARRLAIETYLTDLGLDVLVRDDMHFVATWDEPECSGHDIIEALWELNGEPFEVTQEDFRRLDLHILQHVEDESSAEAA